MSNSYPIRAELAAPRDPSRDIDHDDEARLVRRVQQGDFAAYDQLVRRYLPQALGVARRLLGNKEDAEDLVQDAFLRALDHIKKFRPDCAFAPWFFRLLTNAGLSAIKRRTLRATEQQTENVASLEMPDRLLEQTEIRERFAIALAALPPRQRLIVALCEVDEMSTAEIAAQLAIAQDTVRWHLFQARRSLRVALAPLRDTRRHA